MPSPREQPNPNRNRRRQESMPGGWLWFVVLLLLTVVIYISFGMSGFPTIDYSDFVKLVNQENVAKVSFKPDSNSLVAEIKDPAKLDDALQRQIKSNTKVEVLLWKGDVET